MNSVFRNQSGVQRTNCAFRSEKPSHRCACSVLKSDSSCGAKSTTITLPPGRSGRVASKNQFRAIGIMKYKMKCHDVETGVVSGSCCMSPCHTQFANSGPASVERATVSISNGSIPTARFAFGEVIFKILPVPVPISRCSQSGWSGNKLVTPFNGCVVDMKAANTIPFRRILLEKCFRFQSAFLSYHFQSGSVSFEDRSSNGIKARSAGAKPFGRSFSEPDRTPTALRESDQ